MKKKILVVAIMLAMTAALILAFTGAQFEQHATSQDNVITFGNITATTWAPNPLISETNLVPGQTTGVQHLVVQPNGTIPQDIYFGLLNQPVSLTDAGFGNLVYVKMWVNGAGLWGGNWVTVHSLFTNWQELAANAPAGTALHVQIQLSVDSSLPSTFMGVNYNFYTMFDAVQVGGTPPATAPYLITSW